MNNTTINNNMTQPPMAPPSPPYLTHLPPPQDPFSQPVQILFPDGTPFNVTMDQLTWFHTYTVRLAISRSVALGSTILMLLALVTLTASTKRRSPVFALNLLALLCNTVRTATMAAWTAGRFTNPYAVITEDWDLITTGDLANSVATPVATLITLMLVLASLIMQVAAVVAPASRLQRYGVLSLCAVMAFVCVGFQFAVTVVNSVKIVQFQSGWDQGFQDLLGKTNIVMVFTMLVFMAIFVGKLAMAMWQRRRLGVPQFGPMQILLIMTMQTMIVPTIVSILRYVIPVGEMNTWFLTLVVLSLPLSSLWASASVDRRSPESSNVRPTAGSGAYGTSKHGPAKSVGTYSDIKSMKSDTVQTNSIAPLSPLTPMSPTKPRDLELGLGGREM